MIPTSRRLIKRDWVLIAVAAVGVIAAGLARGQDIEEFEEDNPQPEQQVVYTDEVFDQWLYGNNSGNNSGMGKLSSQLRLRIHQVDRSCGLTDAQKAKLRLAGQGDIKRFTDRVEFVRKRFQKVKSDMNKVGEIYQEIQPLQETLNSGFFHEGTMFAKTVPHTLEPAQADVLAKVDLAKRKYRYRSRVELTVAQLDDVLGFYGDQRQRLVDLLTDETKPPRIFGQSDTLYVLYRASQLRESKIRPIFDDAQWACMERTLVSGRGWEQHALQAAGMSDELQPLTKLKTKILENVRRAN